MHNLQVLSFFIPFCQFPDRLRVGYNKDAVVLTADF